MYKENGLVEHTLADKYSTCRSHDSVRASVVQEHKLLTLISLIDIHKMLSLGQLQHEIHIRI